MSAAACKAYIRLRRKTIGVGSWSTLLRPLTQNIPTCWYILALPNAKICVSPDVKLKICVSPDVKLKICVSPDANPRRQSMEYRWRWAFWRWGWRWGWRWACTFHFFVLISFASGTQRKLVFQWNMGIK